jgi:hypothetical protein
LGGVLIVEQYQAESFTRHSTRVRSPISSRRHRRLARLAIACALMTAGGIVLLTSAIA